MADEDQEANGAEGQERKPYRRADEQGAALSLSQLIGAPIHALIDAEAQAALSTANFIQAVGFQNSKQGNDLGDLRMATFRHQMKGSDGENKFVQVDIPFISMLPIPTLQIRDAELEYTVKVLGTETSMENTRNMLKYAGLEDSPLIEQPAVMRASLAPERSNTRSRSLDMLVKMKVNVEQSDIPAGLSRFLGYASEVMQVKPIDEDTGRGGETIENERNAVNEISPADTDSNH